MDIKKYYHNYDEESRLTRDNSHAIEFITTVKYLSEVVDQNSSILELGAATGKYSCYFAERGHKVSALDLMPHYIELLKEKTQKRQYLQLEAFVGDARDLSHFGNQSQNAVFCLGPFYHFESLEEKNKCLEEIKRVLKPGGVIALAYINHFAHAVASFKSGSFGKEVIDSILDEGIRPALPFHSSHPSEIEELASGFGFEKIHNISTDGISYVLSDKINQLSEDEFQNWIYYHLKTCEESSILGYSLHALYIGMKKDFTLKQPS